MKISKEQLLSSAAKLNLPIDQIEALWSDLEHQEQENTSPFSKFLFYFGGMIAIAALTWFMTLGWDIFGGGGLFLISLVYALLFLLVGHWLWKNKELRIPAGLLVTMAVCMVPLAIYGLQDYFKLWPDTESMHYPDFYTWVKGRWVWMELGTILAGVIALRFFPFPFLTAPIFFSVWYLTMDIVPFLFGEEASSDVKGWVSLLLGLLMLGIGYLLDRKEKRDYAFWSYFFGTLSFWGGLSYLVWDRGEAVLLLYLAINLALMLLSIVLQRRILMVFGAIGVFAYLGHLVHDLFQDSIWFPFILSFIGLAIVALGIWYQKNSKWIEEKVRMVFKI